MTERLPKHMVTRSFHIGQTTSRDFDRHMHICGKVSAENRQGSASVRVKLGLDTLLHFFASQVSLVILHNLT